MKKQLLAAAVAATFAAGVSAAQVEVFGNLDGGLLYTYAKSEYANAYDANDVQKTKKNFFGLESGMSSPSRMGFRGSEDFGNGYSVSFNLEKGFAMDTGAAGDASRFFNRDCRLTVGTPFGEFSFGRMGSLSSSAGRYDLVAGNATVYDGGWSAAIATTDLFYNDFGRMDNTITYMSPNINGFTGYLQHSFKVDESGNGIEGSGARRYFGAGASFATGPVTIVFSAELNKNARTDNSSVLVDKDTKAFSLGGNYAFSNGTKVYFVGQYGVNVKGAAAYTDTTSGTKFLGGRGYNVAVGTAVPCLNGTLKGQFNYSRLNEKVAVEGREKSKYTQLGFALTYEYDFSKQTSAYAGGGYTHMDYKNEGTKFAKVQAMQFLAGLRHSF